MPVPRARDPGSLIRDNTNLKRQFLTVCTFNAQSVVGNRNDKRSEMELFVRDESYSGRFVANGDVSCSGRFVADGDESCSGRFVANGDESCSGRFVADGDESCSGRFVADGDVAAVARVTRPGVLT